MHRIFQKNKVKKALVFSVFFILFSFGSNPRISYGASWIWEEVAGSGTSITQGTGLCISQASVVHVAGGFVGYQLGGSTSFVNHSQTEQAFQV